jgi:hypothetical protein
LVTNGLRARVSALTTQLENALDSSKEGSWMARALDAERDLSAATARASELEREAGAWKRHCKRIAEMGGVDVRICSVISDEEFAGWERACGIELSGAEQIALRRAERSLAALVAQRDTELAAMSERVAKLEQAARYVVAADTYPMIGKSRFEATTEAIAELEKLLPVPPALCARADGKGETNG